MDTRSTRPSSLRGHPSLGLGGRRVLRVQRLERTCVSRAPAQAFAHDFTAELGQFYRSQSPGGVQGHRPTHGIGLNQLPTVDRSGVWGHRQYTNLGSWASALKQPSIRSRRVRARGCSLNLAQARAT